MATEISPTRRVFALRTQIANLSVTWRKATTGRLFIGAGAKQLVEEELIAVGVELHFLEQQIATRDRMFDQALGALQRQLAEATALLEIASIRLGWAVGEVTPARPSADGKVVIFPGTPRTLRADRPEGGAS